MYYRYNKQCVITEKSEVELVGENVCTSDIDFDIELWDIVIGSINDNGVITYYSKRTRSIESLTNEVYKLKMIIRDLVEKIEMLSSN